MSFRKYGGMNYAATHNIVKSNVNTSDSLYVTNNVGQTNSYINFDSDISGNVLIFGDLDLSGNLNVSGDIDCSGNLTVYGKSYLYDDTDISGNLTVTNDVLIDGSLNVIGNINFIGALDASAIYLPGKKPASSYADNEVVPKSYVDTASQGLNVKTPCDCIATYYSGGDLITDSAGNPITFNVTSTYTAGLIIDGYDLSANFSTTTPSRVLVNDQGNPDTTAAVLNGIYVVSGSSTSISFVRSSDMPNGSDALGVYTFIQNGTVYGRSSWVQNQKINNVGEPVIVGTNVLFFSEYQSFKYRLGRGLDLLFDAGNNYTYLNLDTSLNAVNYLDNSYTGTINPGSNTGTINIGAYTTNINIGSTYQTNQINVTGNASFTQDISVNSLTVGLGGGNVSSNSAFGYQALNQNTSGTYNTAVGYQALQNNLSSAGNTAVGCSALNLNQVGYYNTAVGSSALSLNTAGNNTAVGCGALEVNTTGSANTSIGMQSSFFNKTGGANTASGFQALQQNQTGSNNTASGCQALVSSTTDSNTAFGTSALYFNTDGSYNTAIGYLAGSVGDASHNSSCTFLGYNTGNSSPAGVYAPRTKSTAIGYNSVISSDNQIVLGTGDEGVYIPGDYLKIGGTYNKSSGNALDVTGNAHVSVNIDCSGNLNVGGSISADSISSLNVTGSATFAQDISVNSLTVGLGGGNVSSNTAVGYQALLTNTVDGVSNTAVGYQALLDNQSGKYNTAVGSLALTNITVGQANTAVGTEALSTIQTGSNNTAIGFESLYYNNSARNNTAAGYQALYSTIGIQNTGIGVQSLYTNTIGTNNTAIGWQSGFLTDTDTSANTNCTFLGAYTYASGTVSYTNSTALGYNAVINASYQIVLGTTSEGVWLPGDYLQIGSTSYKGKNSGGYALDVDGSANFTKTILVQGEIKIGLGNGTSQTTAVGYSALQQNTGPSNTAIGYSALQLNLGGGQNTALGHNTLINNTTGSHNIALGYQALYNNTDGSYNTAVGDSALFDNKTGAQNTAIGISALASNLSGYENTAVGQSALTFTTGYYNTGIGNDSLFWNVTGIYNTAIGWQSGNTNASNGTGQVIQYCTYLGANTGNSSSTVSYNYSTAIGYNAIISSDNQIVLGTSSEGVWLPGDYLKIGGSYTSKGYNGYALDVDGSANFTQDISVNGLTVGRGSGNYIFNSVLGSEALLNNSTGAYNVAIGFYALKSNTSGATNTAIGAYALPSNTTGQNNIAVGGYALFTNSTGSNNTAIGAGALQSNTTGQNNTAIGYNALYHNSYGTNNVAIGRDALTSNTSGSSNIAIGLQALQYTSSGSSNIAIGLNALSGISTGSSNIAIGDSAGARNYYTPSAVNNCIFLGASTGSNPPTSAFNNSTAIGYNSLIDASNQIVLGTSSEGVYIPGDYLNIGGTYNKSSGYALDATGLTSLRTSGSSLSPLVLYGPTAQPGEGNLSFFKFGFNRGAGSFTPITYEHDTVLYWSDNSGNYDVSAGLVISPWTGNTVGIRISTTGVAVNTPNGTTTTGYALYVTGSSYFTSTVNASSFNVTSDYRIKENVTPLDDTFTVDKLNPVTYTNTKTEKQDVGLIAHELQEHYPFLVNGTKDGEELQSVNYIGLIGVLIKEIQCLKKEVSIMSQQIVQLQNK